MTLSSLAVAVWWRVGSRNRGPTLVGYIRYNFSTVKFDGSRMYGDVLEMRWRLATDAQHMSVSASRCGNGSDSDGPCFALASISALTTFSV